jgi:hypothetical protein
MKSMFEFENYFNKKMEKHKKFSQSKLPIFLLAHTFLAFTKEITEKKLHNFENM